MENQKSEKTYLQLAHVKEWAKKNLNPGIVLMAVAVITLIIANSPLYEWYQKLWNIEIRLGVQEFNLFNHHGTSFTLLQLVNDAIMAIFFLMVGVEIKREIIVGELSSFRKAILPIIAAIGGMIVPVTFFYFAGVFQGLGAAEMEGIAIPMATDIAFSLGVLALLGKRVPLSLKIFLMALAIVDDIGGIIVIAAFYSHFTVSSFVYLGIAALVIGLLVIGNKMEIHSRAFYLTLGFVVWYLFLQAGIHPTIAGVIVAFTVPARPHINLREFTDSIRHNLSKLETNMPVNCECTILNNEQMHHLVDIEKKSVKAISPLQDIEENLHNWVNYFIMPLFAFANAGVIFGMAELNIFSGISLSIILGLFFGKTIGIFLFTWLSLKFKISNMPEGMNMINLTGVAMLGGIGFTVALFLASLSYPAGSELLNQAKMGIIFGSLISGLSGYLILKRNLKANGN